MWFLIILISGLFVLISYAESYQYFPINSDLIVMVAMHFVLLLALCLVGSMMLRKLKNYSLHLYNMSSPQIKQHMFIGISALLLRIMYFSVMLFLDKKLTSWINNQQNSDGMALPVTLLIIILLTDFMPLLSFMYILFAKTKRQ